jgi:hypothetical protein
VLDTGATDFEEEFGAFKAYRNARSQGSADSAAAKQQLERKRAIGRMEAVTKVADTKHKAPDAFMKWSAARAVEPKNVSGTKSDDKNLGRRVGQVLDQNDASDLHKGDPTKQFFTFIILNYRRELAAAPHHILLAVTAAEPQLTEELKKETLIAGVVQVSTATPSTTASPPPAARAPLPPRLLLLLLLLFIV